MLTRGAFESLDQEMLTKHPEIQDGCGAAVALLIGDHVFIALLAAWTLASPTRIQFP